MNKRQEDSTSGWIPSKRFVKRLVMLSLAAWLLLAGTIVMLRVWKRFDTSANMGAVFGASAGPRTSGKRKRKTDFNQFDVDAHIQYGDKLMVAGDPERALEHFRRSEVLLRADGNLSRRIGDALFLLGRFAESEQAYREAVEDPSQGPEVMAKLGLAVFFQKRIEEGIDLVKRSIAKDSSCGECYNALGRVLSGVNPEREGARQAFFQSMMLAPANPDVAYYYAKYLMDHNQYGEALMVLKHLISFAPLYGKAHARLGMVHYYLKNFKSAKKEYEVALHINPNDFNTWFNLGELYYAVANDSSAAMRCFLKTIKLNPVHSKANFRTGLILLHNHQYKESVRRFRKALVQDPNNIRIRMQMAVAYEKLGMRSEAVEVYNEILRISPLNKVARHKIDIITGGRVRL